MYSCRFLPSSLGFFRPSALSLAPVWMGMNKGARDPSLVASSGAVGAGSGSFDAYRGCCGGGDDSEMAFVLWLRRCIGGCSAVDVKPRSLYRSEVQVAACMRRLASPRSSSFSVSGVYGGVAAGSRIESSVADGRFIVLGSGGFVGRLLFSKAWWCSLLWFSFFFSGVAGDGGSKIAWWFSFFFVVVASVLCIHGCTPAYVIRIVLLSL